jgi:hypothetical protein
MALNPLDGNVDGDVPMPSARSTGFVFAGVAALAAFALRGSPSICVLAAAVSAGFLITSLARPAWLDPLNRAWFELSLLLNRIVSPVVMLILFCTTIVPFGVAMQLRRDPLRRRRQTDCASYWIERQPNPDATMSRQF